MGIFKSLRYSLSLICLFSLNQAKAGINNESAILAEVQKCLIPVARSIFEQVVRAPYKDEYQRNTTIDARLHEAFNDRDCRLPSNPSCLHFQTTEAVRASWVIGFMENPPMTGFYRMEVSASTRHDPFDLKHPSGSINVSLMFNTTPHSIDLTLRESLPYLQKMVEVNAVGHDYLGRGILEPLGPPRFEVAGESVQPLSESAVFYNGEIATQIRADLRSYDRCIRNILK